jgi:hypothetical protein
VLATASAAVSPSAVEVVPAGPPAAPPAGYRWWTDQSGGLRAALPRGWHVTRSGGGLAGTGPGGQPVFSVAPWTARGAAIPALVAEEKQNHLPGYLRVRIQNPGDPPGSVWEYTYQDPKAGATRALRWIVTVGGHSYRVDWRAPAADWAANLPALLTVLRTTGPAPGA